MKKNEKDKKNKVKICERERNDRIEGSCRAEKKAWGRVEREGGDPMNNQPCNCPTVFCYIQSRSQRLEGREDREGRDGREDKSKSVRWAWV